MEYDGSIRKQKGKSSDEKSQLDQDSNRDLC